MKIVFIGCVRFSQHCLQQVLKYDGEVVGVVTRRNDGLNSDYADLSGLASEANIPVCFSDDVNDETTLTWIKALDPDIIFCFGWSRLIKQDLLSLPPMGVLGAHPSKLPANRGRHPIIWALALGLRETGLSFFFMNEQADAGPILAQKAISISEQDAASSLYDKIESAASVLIRDFMPALICRTYQVTEQKSEDANVWRRRTEQDGLIDWRMSAKTALNLIKALSKPYPGAEFVYNSKSIKVWAAEVAYKDINENSEPGKVIDVQQGIPVIKCQEGALKLLECEPGVELIIGEYL